MDNRVLSSLIAPIQFAMGSHRVHWRGSQELESFWQLAAGLKLAQVELEHTAALEKTPAYETNGSLKDFCNCGFEGIDEQNQHMDNVYEKGFHWLSRVFSSPWGIP